MGRRSGFCKSVATVRMRNSESSTVYALFLDVQGTGRRGQVLVTRMTDVTSGPKRPVEEIVADQPPEWPALADGTRLGRPW